MTHRYLLHGLRIESGIALPEPPAELTGPVDLEIRLGATAPVDRISDEQLALRWWLDPERVHYEGFRDPAGDWVIRVPNLVSISVDDGTATVRADPALDPALLPMFVAGMGVAFFLTRAGELCLHASGIEADGRAIALSAPSGHGKSTLIALAAASGYPLVGDDLLRVAFAADGPAVYRGAREIRLRAGADALGEHWPGRWRRTADGRTAVAPPMTRAERLPLGAVVFPVLERDRVEVEVERLRPSDAFAPLLSCPRLLGWRDAQVGARQFEQLTTIAAEVPVIVARVPWRTPAGPEVGAALIERVLNIC